MTDGCMHEGTPAADGWITFMADRIHGQIGPTAGSDPWTGWMQASDGLKKRRCGAWRMNSGA
eukprot:366341-Chlamydomonas_euryale.AAC.26